MKALPYLGFDGECAEAFRFSHLMGSDAPPDWHATPQGLSVSLHVTDVGEAERIFAALSDGGSVEMPIGKTFWAERFGMATDRFGIPWMVNCAPET